MVEFLSRMFRARGGAAEWIEIDELQRRMPEVVVIDVRGTDEFRTPPGHLPGAINVPLPELGGRIADVAGYHRPVVLVCKTDKRSARAADVLTAAGVRCVSVLRGGTDGWHAHGLPLD
jgi:rhodanese-related sulfurtransferase